MFWGDHDSLIVMGGSQSPLSNELWSIVLLLCPWNCNGFPELYPPLILTRNSFQAEVIHVQVSKCTQSFESRWLFQIYIHKRSILLSLSAGYRNNAEQNKVYVFHCNKGNPKFCSCNVPQVQILTLKFHMFTRSLVSPSWRVSLAVAGFQSPESLNRFPTATFNETT